MGMGDGRGTWWMADCWWFHKASAESDRSKTRDTQEEKREKTLRFKKVNQWMMVIMIMKIMPSSMSEETA
jgi:hypothetical protein